MWENRLITRLQLWETSSVVSSARSMRHIIGSKQLNCLSITKPSPMYWNAMWSLAVGQPVRFSLTYLGLGQTDFCNKPSQSAPWAQFYSFCFPNSVQIPQLTRTSSSSTLNSPSIARSMGRQYSTKTNHRPKSNNFISWASTLLSIWVDIVIKYA